MPQVHDVRAVQQDIPLYEDLHRMTVVVAEPMIAEAITLTSDEASALLEQQVRGLQRFLLEDSRLLEQDRAELRAVLDPMVRDEVERGVAQTESVSQDFAREFSVTFWDAMLRRMRSHSREAKVIRGDLLVAAKDADGAGWVDLDEVLAPYGLSRPDAAAILDTVMRQLLDSTEGDLVRLPLGLSIDKATLASVLAGEDPPQPSFLDKFLDGFVSKFK
jgi:hypothetical protein